MEHDYIVYQDEDGDYGYVSRSFYGEKYEHLLDSVLVIKDDLSEKVARAEAKRLNGQ